MKIVLLVVSLFMISFATLAQTEEPKPMVSDDPLTSEQIAVYRAFLQGYNNGSGSTLNLANVTDIWGDPSLDVKQGQGCLKGIHLENIKLAKSTVHRTDALASANLIIVDPAKQNEQVRRNDPSTALREGSKTVDDAVKDAFSSGLLTLSEIAFTKDHQWAVMSFSFHCGMLCGHGSVIVLHKNQGVWKITKRNCGGWIA
ncbi:MAG TPA: hypothetical protein VKT33_05315 [Candidatus Angelobacter sp.]|nr:hypothetical protein [Candidatus Angelobacter sp.]